MGGGQSFTFYAGRGVPVSLTNEDKESLLTEKESLCSFAAACRSPGLEERGCLEASSGVTLSPAVGVGGLATCPLAAPAQVHRTNLLTK